MNRAVLEKPFPADIIKTRKGAFGAQLSYVEAVHYIQRLNEAFEGAWSWRVQSHEVRDSEIIVLGVLEAGGQVRQAFGGSGITTSKATGEVVSIADDLKAAATDALKKACSLLGVGLDLYGRETPEAGSRVEPPTGVPANSNGHRREESPPVFDADRNRLTAKQLKAIYAIAHGRGMTDQQIKTTAVKTLGSAPEFLSRQDASTFIDQLKAA